MGEDLTDCRICGALEIHLRSPTWRMGTEANFGAANAFASAVFFHVPGSVSETVFLIWHFLRTTKQDLR